MLKFRPHIDYDTRQGRYVSAHNFNLFDRSHDPLRH